jgi:hypothetical protein
VCVWGEGALHAASARPEQRARARCACILTRGTRCVLCCCCTVTAHTGGVLEQLLKQLAAELKRPSSSSSSSSSSPDARCSASPAHHLRHTGADTREQQPSSGSACGSICSESSTCGVCLDAAPTAMIKPCEHTLCGECDARAPRRRTGGGCVTHVGKRRGMLPGPVTRTPPCRHRRCRLLLHHGSGLCAGHGAALPAEHGHVPVLPLHHRALPASHHAPRWRALTASPCGPSAAHHRGGPWQGQLQPGADCVCACVCVCVCVCVCGACVTLVCRGVAQVCCVWQLKTDRPGCGQRACTCGGRGIVCLLDAGGVVCRCPHGGRHRCRASCPRARHTCVSRALKFGSSVRRSVGAKAERHSAAAAVTKAFHMPQHPSCCGHFHVCP